MPMTEPTPLLLIGLLVVIGAYLIGSVSTAILTCRIMGLPDPREAGSHNPGATNVLRFGGKRAAAITLAGDLLKGLLPVAIAGALGLPPAVLAATGLAAFLGHLFPLYFGFRGGKGVATFLGVVLGLSWLAGLATAATWLLAALVTRISSVGALTAAALAPAYLWWTTGSAVLVGTVAAMTALLYWRHRENIQRLASGREGRIGTP